MLVLTVLAALAFGRIVRQSAAAQLAETPVAFGLIVVRLPEGWIAKPPEADSAPEIVAYDPATRDKAIRVRAMPLADAGDGSIGTLLGMAARRRLANSSEIDLRPRLVDAPRPTRVAGASGSIATYAYEVAGSNVPVLRGGEVVFYRTVAVARVDGVALEVVVDHRDWDGRDALLVRAIADSIRLRG